MNMNKEEFDILNALRNNQYTNQRILAEDAGYSLGKVNQVIKNLQQEGYVNTEVQLTEKAQNLLKEGMPKNAIILAAGFGLRMIPINSEMSKGLIKVHNEVLIERTISQLQDKGIKDITVVVGFMKESYEYLIDKYHVKLKVNMQYAYKNNLHSLALVADIISNTYIIPCDIWSETNPFRENELYSWYMVGDIVDDESFVRVNRKQELVRNYNSGNQMIGIAYITDSDAVKLRHNLESYSADRRFDDAFWEEALFEKDKMFVYAREVDSKDAFEINTFEQLRELDGDSDNLKSDVLELIAKELNVGMDEILDVTVLKKGMTNRSFQFTCKQKRYIMRIPGEGTLQLINRKEEYEVYQKINPLHICDEITYINPENGYKISEYLEDARVCNSANRNDVKVAMEYLREFHKMKLSVNHTFDIFKKIEFYETLWNGATSCYRDYQETKENVFRLKEYIDKSEKEWGLTHIDAVPDNFMFMSEGDNLKVKLIDWEYAGMQDQHMDIAMFSIYALYDFDEVNNLIDIYFENQCKEAVRIKIYAYIAVCGLLWSNWCEYKRSLGVEFGEYALRQYRYAKEYYRHVQKMLDKNNI